MKLYEIVTEAIDHERMLTQAFITIADYLGSEPPEHMAGVFETIKRFVPDALYTGTAYRTIRLSNSDIAKPLGAILNDVKNRVTDFGDYYARKATDSWTTSIDAVEMFIGRKVPDSRARNRHAVGVDLILTQQVSEGIVPLKALDLIATMLEEKGKGDSFRETAVWMAERYSYESEVLVKTGNQIYPYLIYVVGNNDVTKYKPTDWPFIQRNFAEIRRGNDPEVSFDKRRGDIKPDVGGKYQSVVGDGEDWE